jgi:hypothetical protein
MRAGLAGALMALAVACRGTPPGSAQDRDIARLVDSLRPVVERAAGLRFTGPTRSALRSRDEVHAFLLARLREEFPERRQQGIEAVYRLLGMLPDTLDLKKLLLDLYTEQVVGFYDPQTSTLYGVQGADPAQLRFTLAHELVHALQHQYLPLDSILHLRADADQQAAVQAVLEGQATVASIRAIVPDASVLNQPGFWQLAREQVRQQSSTMKQFAGAPLALREDMVFPYLGGAEFMRWWDSARAGQPLPTLAALPRSTEQILHPDRYASGDQPVPVRFAGDSAGVLFEDTLGELEIQILATVLRGGGEVLTGAPIGWGGDRVRVYRSPGGPALVWYLVWDDATSAARFAGGPGSRLAAVKRAGYRTEVREVPGAARPTVRVVIAPEGWARWAALPAIR